ncbi:NAD(P)H-quinone oxidoreductase [Chitinibacteraceae bacterium HSL-7]
MRAIVQSEAGGPLQLGERERPSAGAGQLLVEVRAAGVNRADLAQAAGSYPPPKGESDILGLEVAGVVVDIGAGVSGFAVGDDVFALVAGGGYAEYCVVDAVLAVKKPAPLSWEDAAALPEAWMTAWLNLVEIGGVAPGYRVLIHAGASGVGSAAIQLAVSLGAEVAVTAGNADKLAWCRQLGATLCIDHTQDDFVAAVRAWGGADVILDLVGGDYLPRNQRCLNADGKLIVIGVLRGLEASCSLGLMLVKRQQLIGSTLRALPLARKAAIAAGLWPYWANRRYLPRVDGQFALEDAQLAHERLASNQVLGKLVLLP